MPPSSLITACHSDEWLVFGAERSSAPMFVKCYHSYNISCYRYFCSVLSISSYALQCLVFICYHECLRILLPHYYSVTVFSKIYKDWKSLINMASESTYHQHIHFNTKTNMSLEIFGQKLTS
jgi:hypothetical protein